MNENLRDLREAKLQELNLWELLAQLLNIRSPGTMRSSVLQALDKLAEQERGDHVRSDKLLTIRKWAENPVPEGRSQMIGITDLDALRAANQMKRMVQTELAEIEDGIRYQEEG